MNKGLSRVSVIGGDKRQLYCARAFADTGAKVTIAGFDKIKSFEGIAIASVEDAVMLSDVIVFPLPCIKGSRLNAPYSNTDILIDKRLASLLSGKKIFCGIKQKLTDAAPDLDSSYIYDYSQREEFAVMNSVATAEGAIEIAMREYEGTINGSRCLVCGYGRIGKILSDMLSAIGASITVSARKKSDLAYIRSKNYTAVNTYELSDCAPFDIIFNTVPALVFDSSLLARVAMQSLVIDLASYPGGVDFSSASRLGISTIHALSLPGKCAPKTAGQIIADTIKNMLEEDGRC